MCKLFEAACRICLSENITPPYLFLLEEETATEAIENVLNLQTKLFDVSIYPSHICGKCNQVIEMFIKLQQQSLEHERFILRYQAKIKTHGLKFAKEIHRREEEESLARVQVKAEDKLDSAGEECSEFNDSIEETVPSAEQVVKEDTHKSKTESLNKINNFPEEIDVNRKMKKGWREKHKAGHCDECKKYFKDMSAHKKNFHHIGVELLQCPTCPKSFMGKQQLREHLKRHESEKVSCPQCGPDRIMEKRSLPGHLKTFHKAKDIPCEVPGCKILFKKRADMKNHYLVVHLNKKQLCVQCGDSFKDLKYHVQTVHENINYPCDICHKKYTTKQALNYHVKNQHGVRKKEVCDYCAVEVFNVKHHIKMKHSGPVQKIVPCEDEKCVRLFRTKQEAHIHFNAAHLNKKEMCPLCGGWYKNLYTHIHQIHQSEKKHVCDQCGKAFSKKNDLHVHKDRVHLGKRYVCPECGKTISKLREHMKTVHNNPNFSMADVEDIKYEPVVPGAKFESPLTKKFSNLTEPIMTMMTAKPGDTKLETLTVTAAGKYELKTGDTLSMTAGGKYEIIAGGKYELITGNKGEPVMAAVIAGHKYEPVQVIAADDKNLHKYQVVTEDKNLHKYQVVTEDKNLHKFQVVTEDKLGHKYQPVQVITSDDKNPVNVITATLVATAEQDPRAHVQWTQ